MSFLPPSTFFGRTTRRSVFHWSWLNTRHVRCMSRMAEAHAESLDNQTTEAIPTTKPSFESLGLGDAFIRSLLRAYPKAKAPTDTQAQLIPAVLGTQDILVKDVTGSGKSFGLILGLINKPRRVSKEWKDGKEIEKQLITTVLLVPHRDLAFQLYRIVDRIIRTLPKTHVASVAYVLVRGTGVPIPRQLMRLEATPPHILICTPQALSDAYKTKRDALKLSTLSTIAVDEVDYLVEAVPRKKPGKFYKEAHEKVKKKVARHPGLTRQFLDVMYSKRKQWNEERYSSGRTDEEKWKKTPQLILMSATMHVPLKNYLYEESGWLNKDNLVKIVKNDERKKSDKKKVKKAGDSEVTGERGTVLHSVLVVSEGEPKNIVGARVAPELKLTKGEEEAEAEVDERYDEKYEKTPSPFSASVFEAIASCFALDVPKLGLLVIPSSGPVNRAVYELRRLGVNAQGLNSENILDKATLLVGTTATTRGIDLEELTHVFIIGIPEGPQVNGKSVDAYTHLAGRVGRFGKTGKVITVVCTDLEGEKMVRILRPTRPVLFPYFT